MARSEACAFTWSQELPPAQLATAESDVDRLADELERACRSAFPATFGYHVRVEPLRGLVRGRRCEIRRGGFTGVATVQLYARPGGYRTVLPDAVQLRVSGRARLQSVPVLPRPEPGVLAGLALLALAATVLLLSGFEGSLAIAAHRSGSFPLDALGLLVASAAVLLGARLVALMVRWIADLPRPDGHRRDAIAARGEDAIRWRRITRKLGRAMTE